MSEFAESRNAGVAQKEYIYMCVIIFQSNIDLIHVPRNPYKGGYTI